MIRTRSPLAPSLIALLTALTLATGCSGAAAERTGRAVTAAPDAPVLYHPARDLGPVFHAVQTAGIFPDSKTFADARPLLPPAEIAARYEAEHPLPGFDLAGFVQRHFELPQPVGSEFRADRSRSMEQHIRSLWPVLTREPDTPDARSSLIPLPHAYVVPGGRFREVYYWDSYFTMLGLVRSGRIDLVRGMLDNFAHLVRTVGHVPNGNRTYYLSRSQPPFLAPMVGLYGEATDSAEALRYLDALEAEHAFWMDGADRLAPGEAHRRAVRLPDGSVLNRYWDDLPEPRPESYREDHALGRTLPAERREDLYRNIRAAAESGWDFSSRWMRDPADLRTLETTEIAPVDLNSLLHHSERTISALRAFRGQPGDDAVAERFAAAAAERRRALLAAAYDPGEGFFYDVRWRTGERVTDRPTLAAAAPLYFGLATPEQGRAVAARLERDFLRPGGFVTTLISSGQQWDAPNGWPPLQWLAIQGARRYGREELAVEGRERWLALNRRTYRATGKMTEKYDVVDPDRRAGGGEYPAQDGFGWTNGVALALAAEERAALPRAPGAGDAWDEWGGANGAVRAGAAGSGASGHCRPRRGERCAYNSWRHGTEAASDAGGPERPEPRSGRDLGPGRGRSPRNPGIHGEPEGGDLAGPVGSRYGASGRARGAPVKEKGVEANRHLHPLLHPTFDVRAQLAGRIRIACPPPAASESVRRVPASTLCCEIATGSGLSSQCAPAPSA